MNFLGKQAIAAGFDPGGYVKGPLGVDQSSPTGDVKLGSYVGYLVSAIFIFAGLALLVFFSFGAFQYITGGGDEKQLDKAKKVMTNALLGFVIMSATFIVVSIVGGIFGFNLTNLQFQGPS